MLSVLELVFFENISNNSKLFPFKFSSYIHVYMIYDYRYLSCAWSVLRNPTSNLIPKLFIIYSSETYISVVFKPNLISHLDAAVEPEK